MTEQEIKVIELTKETWNAFKELDVLHKSDEPEFQFHIHALQNIILARDGLRNLREPKKHPRDRIEVKGDTGTIRTSTGK